MDPQEQPAAAPVENTQQAAPAQEQPPEQPPVQPTPEPPVAPSTPPTPPPTPQSATVMPEGDINRRNILPILIVILGLVAVASGIFWWMGMQGDDVIMDDPTPAPPTVPEESAPTPPSRSILSLAETNKVVSALKNQDLDLFADFVSPTKGVRISIDNSVNIANDAILTQSNIRNANANRTVWLWGYGDGTGFPIQDTIYNYLTKNVYGRDYIDADTVHINEEIINQDISLASIRTVYPDADIVEYHFNASEDGNEIGWSSLFLILENVGDRYYLVGILKGNWVI